MRRQAMREAQQNETAADVRVGGGARDSWPVLIVGAGPVGLTLALSLARQGVPSLVIEEDDTVCDGSRALGMSRRSLEIWNALDASEPITEHGKNWDSGRSFYRGRTILEFRMPDDPAIQFRPMLNLQQCHTERYLVRALSRHREVELRWGTRFLSAEQEGGSVIARVAGPAGEYALRARYLVACDGARSAVRSHLGLKLEGTSYEAAYVIADIRLQSVSPMERRCWFDPPSNPGLTILMHGQPDSIWRLDYQLSPDEDPQEAVRPEKVAPRIDAHLKLIGEHGDWSLDWVSVYRVHSRALPDFRHGSIFFAGDAAHLMPIFGIRGLNSGVEDAWNLGWKMGLVLRGVAADALLDSYSPERRAVFKENAALAERNAWFMTPPDDAVRLLRDATLSLSLSTREFEDVLNPRQASYVPLRSSPLLAPDDPTFAGGPPPGDLIPNVAVEVAFAPQQQAWLQSLLGRGFALLHFSESGPDSATAAEIERLRETHDLATIAVMRRCKQANPGMQVVLDPADELRRRFDAKPGTCYLARPDHNILARWRGFDPGSVRTALERCTQGGDRNSRPDPVPVTLSDAEMVYRTLAEGLQAVSSSKRDVFLAKLSLLMGARIGSGLLAEVIEQAGKDLDDPA